MQFGWSVVMTEPGEAHNEMRKLFRQVFGPRTIMEFDTMLEEGADDLCKALSGFSGDPEEVISL
jgi:cytochrome P450